MSQVTPPDRLQELLEALANESLTPAQHAELQNALRDRPAAQERYLAFIDLHLGLRALLGSRLPVRQSPSAAPNKSRHRAVVALAALIVGAVSLSWFYWPDSPDETAALEPVRLMQSAGATFFGQAVPPVNGVLEYGREYALTSGLVELRFPDGAEVILEAPSVVEISAPDRLTVKVGACSVYAPPGAEGFQVQTPQAEVVDHGTRFRVQVNEVGETDVQVVEGEVEVQSPPHTGTAPARRMTSGDAWRFSDKLAVAPQSLPFEAERYRRGLPDRVVAYEARTDQEGHVDELLNVTVQRGGHRLTYPSGELTGVTVTHFRATVNSHNIAVTVSDADTRAGTLEADSLLHTGLVNPGGSRLPLTADPDSQTPGLGVRFREPVVNGPGPDVVLFELQSVVDPPYGDAFHVSPLVFAPGLRSQTVRKYDIAMLDPAARPLVAFELRFFPQPPRTLHELLNNPAGQRSPALRFRALVVGIDLSDLGYAEQAKVSGLFFQDAMDDDHLFDPTFIAGFPFAPPQDSAP